MAIVVSRILNFSKRMQALIAFAVGDRFPHVVAGETGPKAMTQRRRKDEADIAATGSKGLLSRAPRPCRLLAVIRCAEPRGMTGRSLDKPGHDAFLCRARASPKLKLLSDVSVKCALRRQSSTAASLSKRQPGPIQAN